MTRKGKKKNKGGADKGGGGDQPEQDPSAPSTSAQQPQQKQQPQKGPTEPPAQRKQQPQPKSPTEAPSQPKQQQQPQSPTQRPLAGGDAPQQGRTRQPVSPQKQIPPQQQQVRMPQQQPWGSQSQQPPQGLPQAQQPPQGLPQGHQPPQGLPQGHQPPQGLPQPQQPPQQFPQMFPGQLPPGFPQQFPPGYQPQMQMMPPGFVPQHVFPPQHMGPHQAYWGAAGPPTPQQMSGQAQGPVQQPGQFQQPPQQTPPGLGPPPGSQPQQPHRQGPRPAQQPQQQQQRQGPRQQPPQQQQQQQQPPQQQQKQPPKKGPQAQRPPQEPSPSPSSVKAESPPLTGEGDRLNLLALVKPGTKGRKINIESNHLALNVGKLKQAVHYDVTLTPDNPKGMLRDVMNVFQYKHYPKRYPAFDGRKNLYTTTLLPFGESMSDTIKVDGENGPKEFKVEIKFARYVDLTPLHDMMKTKTAPQDALQCLDIVLRNAPANRCITAGRCFFTPPSQIIQLGDGMEMYYGFYQSAIRGWKPLLNVDVAHKAFPSALNLLDLICELGSDYRYTMERKDLGRPLSDNLSRSLEKFLKQLKVKYEITGQSGSKRIHRVNGLGDPPSQAKFKLDNGQTITVDKYFQDVKRVRLQFPHLPTVWVGSKDRDSKILLPIEFCSVVEGQAVNRKMNESQTSSMIKKSATSTDIRKDKIMKSLDKARYNNDPCIKEFGFSVNSQFERLEARILEPPALLYSNKSVVKPSRGVWKTDRSRFLIGATINKWTIAYVTRNPCRVENLADSIFRLAGQSGMQITAKATQPFTHVSGRQTLPDIIQYFKTKQDHDLIFVVVPNSGPQYSFVKQAAELNVGCLTQCIKERTLNKLNNQTVVNILLKVNSKMNGTNHSFNIDSRPPIMSRPCMIMGADVTHPSPDAKDIPSVAAVTASHDPKAFQYNICWRLQPPKVEIIEDLCNITVEQLKFFYTKTGFKPERIVFFRDGVSEGQFKEVQKAEITAIRKACKTLQADGYEPKITFLVVQKRHHTRLFPTNPADSEDKNKNVPAGTCVDTVITNPMMQDFYLVSHASIQGVAKPTKYCTLWDENDMKNDDIEELAYHLCHMFTRCNRSVSYPAPTYYAHLAAARAKVYIENDKLNLEKLKEHQDKYRIKESICKGKPMFFV